MKNNRLWRAYNSPDGHPNPLDPTESAAAIEIRKANLMKMVGFTIDKGTYPSPYPSHPTLMASIKSL